VGIFLTIFLFATSIVSASDRISGRPDHKHYSGWRPKPGVCAIPGKGFEEACDEFRDVIVDLAESAINGDEWNCKSLG
jgi:hypothetical protein